MKVYDITANIGPSMPVYGGKRPNVTPLTSMRDGAPYNFSKVEATTHTGTHADMPLHFVEGGAGCDTIGLDHFVGPARVVKLATGAHITTENLVPLDIQPGTILLINTGNGAHMGQAQLYTGYAALLPCAAQYLVQCGVKTVGIDYLSVDPYHAEDFPVHKILLGSGVCILEGLVLEHVPEGFYHIAALPLKFENGDGSPVRAVLFNIA